MYMHILPMQSNNYMIIESHTLYQQLSLLNCMVSKYVKQIIVIESCYA